MDFITTYLIKPFFDLLSLAGNHPVETLMAYGLAGCGVLLVVAIRMIRA